MTPSAPLFTLLGRVKWTRVVSYALFVAGIGAFLYGCWRLSHPAAFILGGLVLAAIGYLANLDRDPHHFRAQNWDR